MVGWHHQYKGHELGQTSEMVRAERPDLLQSMGLQRVRHNWATEQQQVYCKGRREISQENTEIADAKTHCGTQEE